MGELMEQNLNQKTLQFLYSPKSPPNSPNPELATLVDELKDVYINRMAASNEESDLVFDWSSRPNIPFR